MSVFGVLFRQFVVLDLRQCMAFFFRGSYLRGFFSGFGRFRFGLFGVLDLRQRMTSNVNAA